MKDGNHINQTKEIEERIKTFLTLIVRDKLKKLNSINA
jgi:hypothetical protein